MSDKKAKQILKDLFIRCRKLNILLCFSTQSYFSVPKDVRLNCTQYILFKSNNKRELQNSLMLSLMVPMVHWKGINQKKIKIVNMLNHEENF